MKRLIAAVSVLFPSLAAAQIEAPAPNPMPPCNSPKMERFIAQEVSQLISDRGISVMKFVAPPSSMGWNGYRKVGACNIAFFNTDGLPMTGIFTYHINLVGQMVVSFQDLTQPY
jgi:hypothetical protein